MAFIGGYVKIHGMTPSSDIPDDFDEAGTFRAASARGRLATIVAGPGVNLSMAVVAFAASRGRHFSWILFGISAAGLWLTVP